MEEKKDRQTDRQTDGRTDGQTDRQTDRQEEDNRHEEEERKEEGEALGRKRSELSSFPLCLLGFAWCSDCVCAPGAAGRVHRQRRERGCADVTLVVAGSSAGQASTRMPLVPRYARRVRQASATQSPSSCLSLRLSPSLSPSLSPCLPVSLPVSLSPSLPLFLSPSFSLSLFLSLPPSLPLSLSLPSSFPLSLLLSLCVPLSLSLSLHPSPSAARAAAAGGGNRADADHAGGRWGRVHGRQVLGYHGCLDMHSVLGRQAPSPLSFSPSFPLPWLRVLYQLFAGSGVSIMGAPAIYQISCSD